MAVAVATVHRQIIAPALKAARAVGVLDGRILDVLPSFCDRLDQRVADACFDGADGPERQPHPEHVFEQLAGPASADVVDASQ